MSEAASAGAAAEHCFADDDDRARYHVWMGEPRIRPATPTQDTAAERAVASGGQVSAHISNCLAPVGYSKYGIAPFSSAQATILPLHCLLYCCARPHRTETSYSAFR
jgi:hypothetical protein